jgi:hypothetical protein
MSGILARRPASTGPTVLFIAGHSRSGSTLTDRILGQLPGYFSAGEVRYLWKRGLLERDRCGCGLTVESCPTWHRIGQEGFGGWSEVRDEALALDAAVDRGRLIPMLMRPPSGSVFGARLHRYGQILSALYRSIAAVSGDPVVVDSTMDPSYAYVLRSVTGIDLRVIHLVRDSRGVAYSWTKRVPRPDSGTGRPYLPTYHPARIGARWVAYNALVHMLGAGGVPTIRVRYEEMATDPAAQVARITSWLGHGRPSDLRFLRDGEVDLGVSHTVAGNPGRLDTGTIPLRLDDAWRDALPNGARKTVTALTWPLLLRYGYLGPASNGRTRRGAAIPCG